MRLKPDLDLFNRVFDEAIDLPNSLISQLPIPQLIDVLTQSAQQHFRVKFDLQPLVDREWSEIKAQPIEEGKGEREKGKGKRGKGKGSSEQ